MILYCIIILLKPIKKFSCVALHERINITCVWYVHVEAVAHHKAEASASELLQDIEDMFNLYISECLMDK